MRVSQFGGNCIRIQFPVSAIQPIIPSLPRLVKNPRSQNCSELVLHQHPQPRTSSHRSATQHPTIQTTSSTHQKLPTTGDKSVNMGAVVSCVSSSPSPEVDVAEHAPCFAICTNYCSMTLIGSSKAPTDFRTYTDQVRLSNHRRMPHGRC